jgi:CheY-like chemotaxis protein
VNDATDRPKIQRTMLVIDDQESVRTILDYLLGLDGYRVLTASSGPAAIVLAENELIDGAMIDIHMPVMDGFATCARLQASAKALGRSIRVWFMSGAFSGALKQRSFELGALGLFSKPFDPLALSKRLEEGFSPLPTPTPPEPIANPSTDEADQP